MASKSKSVPSNPALYKKVKSETKRKFKVYPSAYANAWLVKEYKRRGGKYRSSSSRNTSKKSTKKYPKSTGLSRWFDEKWIDVCKLPKKVSCGRSRVPLSKSKSKKTYPYCRPSKRISSKTPRTASELSKEEIKRRCRSKKRNPSKKIY